MTLPEGIGELDVVVDAGHFTWLDAPIARYVCRQSVWYSTHPPTPELKR
jgi:hypothetical protein